MYPLIERARWHRRIRGRTEAIWNYIGGRFLHLPDAGVALDRVIEKVVPAPLVAELDQSMNLLTEDPRLDDEQGDPFAAAPDEADRLTASLGTQPVSLVELASEPAETDKGKSLLPLADPNPYRFSQGQLHDLWKEALQALQSQAASTKPGFQAGQSPTGPDRPLSACRHSVDPRTRSRPDRHPGHGQQANRAHHAHAENPWLGLQTPARNLALPRQQPRHRSPRLHEHRALRPLACTEKSPAQFRGRRVILTMSCSRSGWSSPIISTKSSPVRSSPGTPRNARFAVLENCDVG